ELHHVEEAGPLSRDRIQHRADQAARGAPLRPVLHDDRPGRPEHLGLEGVVGHCPDCAQGAAPSTVPPETISPRCKVTQSSLLPRPPDARGTWCVHKAQPTACTASAVTMAVMAVIAAGRESKRRAGRRPRKAARRLTRAAWARTPAARASSTGSAAPGTGKVP